MRTLSVRHARRIALTAMGLARPRPAPGRRRDVRHLRRVLDTVDVVQLDSVNVLTRAHELPFWSRLGPHDRRARDRWLWRSREALEGWAHVASVAPVEVWPLLAHRRAAVRPGTRVRAIQRRDPGYLERVLEEVRRRGPSSVRDLEEPGQRSGPWWGDPPGRVALSHLALRGDLAVDRRTDTFMAVYDLADRVVPAEVHDAEVPAEPEATRRLLLRAARAHGIGTAADLADHYRLPVPHARPTLAQLAAAGHLEEVRVRGWGAEPVYRHPRAGAARTFPARTLLSPFDPLVWFRPRLERLFDFHYRIEIYVPEAQRVHGYYVLPFLLGEDLTARVDLKADRAGDRLLVRGAFAEGHVDRRAVACELAVELRELAAWLGLAEIEIAGRGDLADPLAARV